MEPQHVRITLSCPDDRGLLAAVAARLYDLGGDIGDAAFSLLGDEAQMTCIASFPASTTPEAVRAALAGLPALKDATIAVERFSGGRTHPESGHATHVVTVQGDDRPGLMARLAEGFGETGANVVRMDAERRADGDYRMRFAIWVPKGRAEACLANAANAAERMGLRFSSSEVGPGER
ncbi:MAG: glycine cleavage system protein R [Sandaracinaceae bacterium]